MRDPRSTIILTEVPGARERPGNCEIVIEKHGNEFVVIIPARPSNLGMRLASAVLAVNLAVVFVDGVALFLFGVDTYPLRWMIGDHVSSYLKPYSLSFALLWLILVAGGLYTLFINARATRSSQTIRFTPGDVELAWMLFGATHRRVVPRSEVRGFRLRRDPQGLRASGLTLETRDASHPLAEHAREADKEWLESVGNTLLER